MSNPAFIPPSNIEEEDRIWDRYGSTFRHEIYQPTRRPDDPLHGYSNKETYTEKKDRLKVLRGLIHRIWFVNGYRHKSTRMDIYVQTGPVRKEHPLVLSLYPGDFQAHGVMLQAESFLSWLKTQFRPDTTVNGGVKSLSDLLFSPEKVGEAEDQLRLRELAEKQMFRPELAANPLAEVAVFADHMALHNYCVYLTANRIRPVGAVNAYYMAMLRRFPDRYTPPASV